MKVKPQNKSLIIILIVLLVGCSSGNDVLVDSTDFDLALSDQTIDESSQEAISIEIELTQELPTESELVFSLSSELIHGVDYQTNPEPEDGLIKVLIKEGERKGGFEINTIDNNHFRGNTEVIIKLESTSANLNISTETPSELKVEIIEDEIEAPISVSFEKTEMSLSENAWPEFASSDIIFSQTTTTPVKMKLREITPIRWGYDYDSFYGPDSRTPTCTDGRNCEVTIELETGQTVIKGVESFAFNNDVRDGDRIIVFEIVEIDQDITIPSNGSRFTLTITDDD